MKFRIYLFIFILFFCFPQVSVYAGKTNPPLSAAERAQVFQQEKKVQVLVMKAKTRKFVQFNQAWVDLLNLSSQENLSLKNRLAILKLANDMNWQSFNTLTAQFIAYRFIQEWIVDAQIKYSILMKAIPLKMLRSPDAEIRLFARNQMRDIELMEKEIAAGECSLFFHFQSH